MHFVYWVLYGLVLVGAGTGVGGTRCIRVRVCVRCFSRASGCGWLALAAARRRRVWEGGHPLRLREVTSVATMWAVRAECCRERRVAIPFGPGRALERLGVTGDVHRCGECMRTRVTLADPTSTL